jgi:hypothetical protein
VLDDPGVMRLGVADGSRLEVERVEVEGAAALRGGEQSPGPAGGLRRVHRRDVAGADDAQRGALLLDDAGERDLERGGDRPQRLDAGVRAAGLELGERRLAQARGRGELGQREVGLLAQRADVARDRADEPVDAGVGLGGDAQQLPFRFAGHMSTSMDKLTARWNLNPL